MRLVPISFHTDRKACEQTHFLMWEESDLDPELVLLKKLEDDAVFGPILRGQNWLRRFFGVLLGVGFLAMHCT